jgi:hypothetical protein
MLPENVLEEFTRSTQFSVHLVRLAWPSLSAESRLQVVQAIQGMAGGTPDWLTELALTDPHPIVRYWAARRSSLAGDKGEALIAKIEADNCELVRACLRLGGFAWSGAYKRLDSASHIERLAFFRNNLDYPYLLHFVEWLERAVAAGTSDRELAECALEFFESPRVKRYFTESPVDGHDAYSRGLGMRKGWELTKRAGLGPSIVLTRNLPTDFGLDTMEAEELAQLPDRALEHVIYRADESAEANELLAMIQKTPEKFSEEIRKTASFMAERLAEERARQSRSLEKEESLLETVLSLKRELSELRDELRRFASEAASRKRGLFG